jgi:MarR family transcriptional regulator, temperature-dependent positive regulator of motility
MAKEPASNRLERSPLHLLHRVGQCAAHLFQAELGDDDLTPRQYAVLLTVALNEGLNQTQLVERTGIDRSTLADVVRRMLKKGMLQRRRTRDDARAYAVKLTDKGAKLLKTYDPMARRVDDRILASLPAGQRDRFLNDLNSIVDALNQVDEKEASG